MNAPRQRCAIYTRKSTEEGLDQEFNSLDAQREACAAFITSQVGLGWKLVPDRYDDPGFSGGSMERPALKRLLEDIREKRIDVVVVYKIDRLTRSLTDFSRIVEVFDKAGVSFVSVTQQFNTTTSMGRLTLNVLLSFAQFEREVTAERIRDKIAASKKKGMWMGGVVPLGYRVENKKLIVHPEEAETVRWLFERYLQLKSVRALIEEAGIAGMTGRPSSRKDGEMPIPFGRAGLGHLLSNPIYVGSIRHKDRVYEGAHEAIVTRQTFDETHLLLKMQAPRRTTKSNTADHHMLTGRLFDDANQKLRAVHANKKGVRYRYYVSRMLVEGRRKNDPTGWRLPADEIDAIVVRQLALVLGDHSQVTDWIVAAAPGADLVAALQSCRDMVAALETGTSDARREIVVRTVRRVVLEPGFLTVEIDQDAILADCIGAGGRPADVATNRVIANKHPISLRRRGVELRIVVENPSHRDRMLDHRLVHLTLSAHRFMKLVAGGHSIAEIADEEGVDASHVSRVLPMAFLSPAIVDRIFAGTQPANITASYLSRFSDLPVEWRAQEVLFR